MERDNAYYKKLHDEFSLIFKKIKEANRIVIYRHESPDFDALGTQMGLYEYIKFNWPEKEVHYVGDNVNNFMPRIFPVAQELDDEFYKTPYLAIVVDTANVNRIAKWHNGENATDIIKMDHHPEAEDNKFGTVSSVHPEMAAASELVALFIQSMNKFNKYPLTKEAAFNFYIGIVGDSGRFQYPEVSPMTFRVAADLIDTGLDIVSVYDKMYFTSKERFALKKYIIDNYVITEKGTCYYILTDEDLKRLGVTINDGNSGTDIFRNIEGVKCVVSCTQDVSKNNYRVSMRATHKKVNKVAVLHNGGGHDGAAGARVNSLDEFKQLIQECDDLKEEID